MHVTVHITHKCKTIKYLKRILVTKQNIMLNSEQCTITRAAPCSGNRQHEHDTAVLGAVFTRRNTLGPLCVSSCGFCQCNQRSHYTIQRLVVRSTLRFYSHRNKHYIEKLITWKTPKTVQLLYCWKQFKQRHC